ncbi:MAG TPA: hypothetical protein VGF50_13980 [Caulobacteraceae bacterium]|jgi:hypothetical protein
MSAPLGVPPTRWLTRRRLATVIVVVGASWTLLTGACTGAVALMTMGVALMFGAPLVLGGAAVWLAGRLLRGDPADVAVRRWALTGAIASALAILAAAVVIDFTGFHLPSDDYGLSALMVIFTTAGAVGALVLMTVSLGTLIAGRKAGHQPPPPEGR